MRRQSRDVQPAHRTWSLPRGPSSLNSSWSCLSSCSQGNSKRKTALASPSNPESPLCPSGRWVTPSPSPCSARLGACLPGTATNRHTCQRPEKDQPQSRSRARGPAGQRVCADSVAVSWEWAAGQRAAHPRSGQRWLRAGACGTASGTKGPPAACLSLQGQKCSVRAPLAGSVWWQECLLREWPEGPSSVSS